MPLAVCATPIGNLEDVTLRVLAELAAAEVVLCEDTRRTRVLLERHGIAVRLLSYHEHNEAQRTAELLPRLEAGERIALVSDAGLPGVSDPGARLVRAALDAGVDVTVLPGASAVETALVASGLVAEQYRFLGFLPRGERRLAAMWEELRGWSWPAVAFESPQRLPATLRSLAGADPEREVAVCRELTKRFEEVVRGAARELAQRFDAPPKGEITIVLGPAAESTENGEAEERALAAVAELVEAGVPRKRAAEVVSKLAGISRNRLYKASL
jgi:16S rRNA (cytidine1402-2'-O)-methyltransferase